VHSSQAPVPQFKLTAPQLMNMVDEVGNHAAQALELGEQALALTSGLAREAVERLLDHVKHIGFTADAAVEDCHVDLAAVWRVQAGQCFRG